MRTARGVVWAWRCGLAGVRSALIISAHIKLARGDFDKKSLRDKIAVLIIRRRRDVACVASSLPDQRTAARTSWMMTARAHSQRVVVPASPRDQRRTALRDAP